MAGWKKGFKKIPASVRAKIEATADNFIRVVALKSIPESDIISGDYQHLLLDERTSLSTAAWDVVPTTEIGITSRRNTDGWEEVRKDLPKVRKYFYQDIPIYGDGARNGWTTAAIPREVYERQAHPPRLFAINIDPQNQVTKKGHRNVVFAVDAILDKHSISFEADLLFALNILQENTGVSGVTGEKEPIDVATSAIDWEVFPPGSVERIVSSISTKARGQEAVDRAKERLELLEQYDPIEFLKGFSGSHSYIGARYADDLVVFENLKAGNAMYVLYQDWKELSQKPRSELLAMSTKNFDRIVHYPGWENRFATLMQRQLQDRGIRIRIGGRKRYTR